MNEKEFLEWCGTLGTGNCENCIWYGDGKEDTDHSICHDRNLDVSATWGCTSHINR